MLWVRIWLILRSPIIIAITELPSTIDSNISDINRFWEPYILSVTPELIIVLLIINEVVRAYDLRSSRPVAHHSMQSML